MKKRLLIMALIGGSIAFECPAVVFNFKGGAANTIDIALFKHRGKFEDFIEKVGGSKNIANTVEKFTKENSEYFGGAVGGLAGVAATAAITATATPAVGAAASTIIVPTFTKVGQIGFENYGRIAQFGARLVKSAAKKLYASHYLENVRSPNKICLGLVGKNNRLIRSKEIFNDDKLMEFNNIQPMYVVIFNSEVVRNKNDIEYTRNAETDAAIKGTPHIYARSGDIIYAGELPAEQLLGSIDITTHFIKKEAFDDDETPILDQHNKPLVLERSVGVQLTPIDSFGGIECK